MRQQKNRVFLFSILLLLSFLFLSTQATSNAITDKIYIGSISAKGDIQLNSTITMQVTIMNTYSSAKIRNIGMVLPTGLVNQSPLLVRNVNIAGDSFRLVNFTVLIKSLGDFELLFYTYDGSGIEDYTTRHLLIQSYPSQLPPEIVVNETLWINATIPVSIDETVNVSNYLTNNNYNNFTCFVNETVYNAIINNITNTIINNVYYNITIEFYFYYNQSQWQNQTQWQQQWIVFDIPSGILYGSMVALGLVGVHNIASGESTIIHRRRRSKWQSPADDSSPVEEEEMDWEINRRVQYGYCILGAIVGELIGALLIFQYLPISVQLNFSLVAGSYAPFLFGLFIALSCFVIILSLDEPINLIIIPILGTLFALFLNWFWFIFALVFTLLAIAVIYTVRARHTVMDVTSEEMIQHARQTQPSKKSYATYTDGKRSDGTKTDWLKKNGLRAFVPITIFAMVTVSIICLTVGMLWVFNLLVDILFVSYFAIALLSIIFNNKPDAQTSVLYKVFAICFIAIVGISITLIVLNIIDLFFLAIIVPFAISFVTFFVVTQNILPMKRWYWIPIVGGPFLLASVLIVIFFFATFNGIALFLGVALLGIQIIYTSSVVKATSDDRFWGFVFLFTVLLFAVMVFLGALLFSIEAFMIIGSIMLIIGFAICCFIGIMFFIVVYAIAKALEE